LIFEGSTNAGGCGDETFCQGLPGINPQRSNQSGLLRNLFWEMLSQKEPGTAFGRKLRAVPVLSETLSIIEGSRWPYAFGLDIAGFRLAEPKARRGASESKKTLHDPFTAIIRVTDNE
jgi:hypothetical protein